eukprot:1215136-Rhodomonas_salina.1
MPVFLSLCARVCLCPSLSLRLFFLFLCLGLCGAVHWGAGRVHGAAEPRGVGQGGDAPAGAQTDGGHRRAGGVGDEEGGAWGAGPRRAQGGGGRGPEGGDQGPGEAHEPQHQEPRQEDPEARP